MLEPNLRGIFDLCDLFFNRIWILTWQEAILECLAITEMTVLQYLSYHLHWHAIILHLSHIKYFFHDRQRHRFTKIAILFLSFLICQSLCFFILFIHFFLVSYVARANYKLFLRHQTDRKKNYLIHCICWAERVKILWDCKGEIRYNLQVESNPFP